MLKSEIGPIILKHPEIFKNHYDAEYLVLIVYFFYEMLKGEKSFWFPYFDVINISDIPMVWNEDEIDELQDAVLKRDVDIYRSEFEEEWKLILESF